MDGHIDGQLIFWSFVGLIIFLGLGCLFTLLDKVSDNNEDGQEGEDQ